MGGLPPFSTGDLDFAGPSTSPPPSAAAVVVVVARAAPAARPPLGAGVGFC